MIPSKHITLLDVHQVAPCLGSFFLTHMAFLIKNMHLDVSLPFGFPCFLSLLTLIGLVVNCSLGVDWKLIGAKGVYPVSCWSWFLLFIFSDDLWLVPT